MKYKENMTFYSPDEKTPIKQQVPDDELEIKMERKDIYNLLIESAHEPDNPAEKEIFSANSR